MRVCVRARVCLHAAYFAIAAGVWVFKTHVVCRRSLFPLRQSPPPPPLPQTADLFCRRRYLFIFFHRTTVVPITHDCGGVPPTHGTAALTILNPLPLLRKRLHGFLRFVYMYNTVLLLLLHYYYCIIVQSFWVVSRALTCKRVGDFFFFYCGPKGNQRFSTRKTMFLKSIVPARLITDHHQTARLLLKTMSIVPDKRRTVVFILTAPKSECDTSRNHAFFRTKRKTTYQTRKNII